MPYLTRRAALAGLMGALPAAALANAPETSLRPLPRPDPNRIPDIDAILGRAGLTGRATLACVDVETGGVIEARNARQGLPPASVMKALTAAYALDTLGEDFRFETRLLGTGPVEAGTLKGDLILAGGGDPTLDTPRLDAMAAALAGAGVRRIEGRFLTWDAALPYVNQIDPEQDDHLGYNATLSGLNLNFNRVHFAWARRGGTYDVDMDARGGQLVPAVSSSVMRIEDRRLPVYTYASVGGTDRWTVARRALGQGGARWLPVRNPAAYAADVLRTLARGHGVTLPEGAAAETLPEGATALATDRSRALPRLCRDMLRFSTNLTAEALGVAASLARGPLPEGPVLAASGARMAGWADERLGLRGVTLIDHSGLGDESRVGAGPLADAMARIARGGADLPDLVPLLRGFGMPDASGELTTEGPIRVSAKTGTLNFVSGLSGVAEGRGRRVAFAIVMADLPARARGLASGDEIPSGARPWGRAARRAQRELIDRWIRLSELSAAP